MAYSGGSLCITYPTLATTDCGLSLAETRMAIDSSTSSIQKFAFVEQKGEGGFKGSFEPKKSLLNGAYTSIYTRRNLASVYVS